MSSAIASTETTRGADRLRRAADVLVDTLLEAGVEVVFGLPGGTIAPLYDALLDRPEIRCITTRHEAGAMFAAAGYARTSGKLGVVLVTSGPGVLNCVTGLASAYCDGLPVLLLGGEVPRALHGRGALQEGSAYQLNVVAMLSHVTKLAREIPDAAAAPLMLRRAIATALSGKRGPVALTLPLDVTSARIRPANTEMAVATHFELPPSRLAPAVRLIRQAKRPVLFAGSGVRQGAGPERLRELAEHLQWPVMTTPKGKGVFPESHRLSLGVFGLGGHPSTYEYLRDGVDVLLAVGTSLGDLATNGWDSLLCPRKGLIHVDLEAGQLARGYAAEVNVIAPAELVLEQLKMALPPAAGPRTFGLRRHCEPQELTGSPAAVAPQRAIWELQRSMPPGTIFVIDSGEHFLFATHYLEIDEPDAFIAMVGLGAMGSSIGGALGAKLARPHRPTAVIMGDGGYAMVGSEIGTAVQAGVPLVVFVFNDRRLAMVEIGHETVYGRSPAFPVDLDVAGFAESLGARVAVAVKDGDITEALRRHDFIRPLVVDVRIDPAVRHPKKDRIAAMQRDTAARLN